MDLHHVESTLGGGEVPMSSLEKSFPALQLSIIFLIQFSEPITSTIIYPFINQLVGETGITRGDESKTGYYAGFIESVFFLAECLSVYYWGRLSDRVGRRPVLLLGPLGLTLAMLVFGLSHNFGVLVLSRGMQGVFNGNIGVGKVMIAEITDTADTSKAFGWIPAIWGVGIALGPVIGGVLAKPAVRWPNTFRKLVLFQQYPYFLPCVAAGAVAFISYLFAYVLLQEVSYSFLDDDVALVSNPTHESLPGITQKGTIQQSWRGQSTASSGSSMHPIENGSLHIGYGAIKTANGEIHRRSTEQKTTSFSLLFTRQLLVSLTCYGFISFLDQCHQVLLPLVFSTSISLGGLGLDSYTIGITMGSWGILNAAFQVMAFARMIRWLGPRRLCIVSFSCLFLTFAAFPLMTLLIRWEGKVNNRVCFILVAQLCLYSIAYMSYGCVQLSLIHATDHASLGAVNGLGQMISSTARTLAPITASSLFSISLQKQIAGGYMVYVVLLGVTLAGAFVSFQLPSQIRAQKG